MSRFRHWHIGRLDIMWTGRFRCRLLWRDRWSNQTHDLLARWGL